MTIWCKLVHRLELQKFIFYLCAAHSPVRLDIETKSPYFLFLTWLSMIRNHKLLNVFARFNVLKMLKTTISSCFNFIFRSFLLTPPCRIRYDRQTTSLTLTTGVCEAGTKIRGASNMNIHYDVTGLLTAAWRSQSGRIVWAAWINCELAREEEGGGGFWTHSTYTGYPGSAGGRQLDRWRWLTPDFKYAWVYHTIECHLFAVLQTYTTRHVDKDTVKCGDFHDVS